MTYHRLVCNFYKEMFGDVVKLSLAAATYSFEGAMGVL